MLHLFTLFCVLLLLPTSALAGSISFGNSGGFVNGTIVSGNAVDDQVILGTTDSAAVWATLPSCSNGTTSKLLYNNATNTWSCGTDQGGVGASILLDLADNGVDESTALAEIATSGDTNSIFTEPTADKLLITLSNDWPKADTADDLTCTDCIGPTEITDLTLGTDTAGNYAGSASEAGPATTALALDANPADCGANTFANAIAASGALTCAAVGNAATTATDANTASAIVARDISGNFAAGTITAALTGTATLASDLSCTNCIGPTEVTDLTLGTDTAGNYAGSASEGGAATTATALAANGANCTPGEAAGGVDATGAAEDCFAPAGTGDITRVAACLDGNCGIEGGNDLFPILHEGTANTEETTISITEPTADHAIAFPANSGTVAVAVTAPITLSATGVVALTQDAGTNVAADLEEETHATEHQDGGADELALDGTQITTGTVANARTTATDANTASAIVARDISGNFTAGTITAALTGTATLASDLSCTNCIGPTEITDLTLGTDTAGNYAGSASESGPATTALALDANGANCSAGSVAGGVDASGVSESCLDPILDSDVSASEGFLRKTGAGAYVAHKSNLAAVVDPQVTDDTAAGYSVGSVWINTTDDTAFVCVDATADTAVWVRTDNVALTLQNAHDNSGANPEIDVGANGQVISDLTSITKSFKLCNADESQCWIDYVDATLGPVRTTLVPVDAVTTIPDTLDFFVKDSAGANIIAVDEATRVVSLPDATLLDLSAINASSQTEGFKFPQTTVPAPTAEGLCAWDTDDNQLKCGDGATTTTIGSGGSTVVTSIPMKLSSVNVSNANAFVDTIDGTNFDYSGTRYVDNVVGIATYTMQIPDNLAATPAWELIIQHKSLGAETGDLVVVLDVTCNAIADDQDWDAAGTALEADLAVTCDADAGGPNLTMTALNTSGDYDSEEPLAAGDLLVCIVSRDGDNAPDTLSADWLLLNLSVRLTVNS